MRVFEICTVGAAVVYLSLGFSHSGTGYAQAAAFLFAIAVGTVTAGVAIAVASHSWPTDAGLIGPGPARRCHGCGRRMVGNGMVWVCGRCDRPTRQRGSFGERLTGTARTP